MSKDDKTASQLENIKCFVGMDAYNYFGLPEEFRNNKEVTLLYLDKINTAGLVKSSIFDEIGDSLKGDKDVCIATIKALGKDHNRIDTFKDLKDTTISMRNLDVKKEIMSYLKENNVTTAKSLNQHLKDMGEYLSIKLQKKELDMTLKQGKKSKQLEM